MSDTVWRPNKGPQLRFLQSRCFEVLYGGAAGGGKSDALLAGAARHVHLKRYRGVLARRTVPELEGTDGLIERSHEMYLPLGAYYLSSKKRWLFPSGARVSFITCEDEKQVRRFGGWQFQYLGVDELTTFTKKIYEYLIARLRSTTGIPCFARATSNPGGEGHDWVLDRYRWWLYRPGIREDEHTGPYLQPGERTLVMRDPDTGRDELCGPDTDGASERLFIPALLADNPMLAATDYGDRLKMLDVLSRRQLEDGDWMARSEPGMFWDRGWIDDYLDEPPKQVRRRIRYWDLAGTDDESGKKDPAWTCGTLMSETVQGRIVVEDVARCRRDPGGVEDFFEETAAADLERHGRIDQWMEQDPGQAGKAEIHSYRRRFGDRFDVMAIRPSGDKVTRFKPFSAAAKRGEVSFVRGRWNEVLHDELESFPPTTRKKKADQADSSGGAYAQLRHTAIVQIRTSTKRRSMQSQGVF